MSISNIVDNRAYKPKDDTNPCQKNIKDCMFRTSKGCAAEWCIFAELPQITTETRTLTCSICGKNKKKVSMLSGMTSYICSECQEKIHKVIDNPTCAICGAKVEQGQSLCSVCISKIRSKINE